MNSGNTVVITCGMQFDFLRDVASECYMIHNKILLIDKSFFFQADYAFAACPLNFLFLTPIINGRSLKSARAQSGEANPCTLQAQPV
jgi:hypothetical protein